MGLFGKNDVGVFLKEAHIFILTDDVRLTTHNGRRMPEDGHSTITIAHTRLRFHHGKHSDHVL